MNILYERGALFTNGLFGVVLPSGRKRTIIGYTHKSNLVVENGEVHSVISADGCTLIARNIDSMTRQELNEIPVFKTSGMSPSNKINWLKNSIESLEHRDVMFMVDNGVFPYDPDYFERGEVITHT